MRNALSPLIAVLCLLAGAARAQAFLEPVASADRPSFLADPDDGTGRLFVSELGLPGRIRILFPNGTLQEPNDAFLELPDVDLGANGEGGLHSLAFDPGFATNHKLYVAYTRTGTPLETVIASYTARANDPNHADPASAVEILTQQAAGASNHKGGQLQIGPDGLLYFAFGDGGGGDDPSCFAQTRDVRFGKLLRIDPSHDDYPTDASRNYAIPAGNPFASDPNYLPEIWSLGLRNPYRFSFDRQTKALWIGDVGQGTREEVDLSVGPNAGSRANYGWKMLEGNVCRWQSAAEASCPAYVRPCGDMSYTAPVHDYQRGTGGTIIGGYVYRGGVGTWRGRYIFADFLSSTIFALVKNGSGWKRVVLSTGVSRPISFGEDRNGELYVLSIQGGVYRLHFEALPPTREEQACVRRLNERFVAAAASESALVRACVDRKARGRLMTPATIETCAAESPKSRLERIRTGARQDDAKLCSALPPEVGYAGADVGMDASLAAELGLAKDVLGQSLDLAPISPAVSRNAYGCQRSVLAALASCQSARRGEFLRCKKGGLRDGSFTTSENLAMCLDDDPALRVSRACDPAGVRLRTRVIEAACVKKGVTLSQAFPGCGTDDPDALAQCLATSSQCRTCELFDAADGLGTDCTQRGCAP